MRITETQLRREIRRALIEGNYDDVGNEASVQALAPMGFRYDRQTFQEIRDSVDGEETSTPLYSPFEVKKSKLLDDAESELQRAEAMSSAARDDFLRAIEGKVVIMNIV